MDKILYENLLKILCSDNEIKSIKDFYELDDYEILVNFISNKICLIADWSEYRNEQHFFNFISFRLTKKFMCSLKFDIEKLVKKFYKPQTIIKKGDWMIFIISQFNYELEKIKKQILGLDLFDDQYRLFVVDKKDIKYLTNLNSDFWRFHEF